MKRFSATLLLLVSTLLFAQAAIAQSSVFISELCDPRQFYLKTDSTDRFIEIFNAGDVVVDLTGWKVVAIGNGSDIFTWNLSGFILPGQALVAGDDRTSGAFQADFAEAAWSNNVTTWNGKVDDGAKLLNGSSEVVDLIYATGTLFENSDMERNSDVFVGSTTLDVNEWTIVPCDTSADASPGEHQADLLGIGNPHINNIGMLPGFPVDGDPVAIDAVVVDTAGTLTSVTLNWGLSPEALDSTIAMSVVVDSTWGAVEFIPGQASGVTVWYQITAISDHPDTNRTPIESYTVAHELSISSIQSMAAQSLFAGDVVVTEGTVTAAYSGYAVIQHEANPWQGIWLRSDDTIALGDSLRVWGTVVEDDIEGFAGATLLDETALVTVTPSNVAIDPVELTIAEMKAEDYEGVLVTVDSVACSAIGTNGDWSIEDEIGEIVVGTLGTGYSPVIGSSYTVTGVILNLGSEFLLEPRSITDITFLGDFTAPTLEEIEVVSSTQIVAIFSETLDETTAETAANYEVDGVAALSATMLPGDGNKVSLIVNELTGTHTLVVTGVEDLAGNAIVSESLGFEYATSGEPAGYYDSAAGLTGEELRQALHDIIADHHDIGYDSVWYAYYTTDVKPNGKVWDIYSDVPGGTPAYEFDFGVDQDVGTGGNYEGEYYNREHSWPKSWFGSEPPLYSDLFILYPVDKLINSTRNNYPYGEVGVSSWVSTNGSMLGTSVTPGYSGTVFEPIDEYKGDLARTYFYVMARYYGEDGDWPGSDAVDGADLKPWAQAMMLAWHEADPVSQKEVVRNNAVYAYQHNRNPFIDHPEFVTAMFNLDGVNEVAGLPASWTVSPVYPNPFNASATVRFGLPAAGNVHFEIYDLTGRHVATLLSGNLAAGWHAVSWNAGSAASGTYFLVGQFGKVSTTRKLTVVK